MKQTFLVLVITAWLSMISEIMAADGAQLFIDLTCYTCHGAQGKGMVRTETKGRWALRKKIFKELEEAGLPKAIIAKLKPLDRVRFEDESEYYTALENELGKTDAEKYRDLIFETSGKIVYRKGELVKGFEEYPRLAGNKEIYLFQQMKAILGKERINGNSEAMRGIKPFLDTKGISDDDFRALARYLSQVQ